MADCVSVISKTKKVQSCAQNAEALVLECDPDPNGGGDDSQGDRQRPGFKLGGPRRKFIMEWLTDGRLWGSLRFHQSYRTTKLPWGFHSRTNSSL
jgi:hypothetical protein